jgi:hypothetical protein
MTQPSRPSSDPLQFTLTELEGQDWGPPKYITGLVQSAHRLRHVPLKDLSHDEVRLLLGQDVGTAYLTPVALDLLATDPLIETSYYPGDLLRAVLAVSPDFWESSHALAERAKAIAQAALFALDNRATKQTIADEPSSLAERVVADLGIDDMIRQDLHDALQRFIQKHSNA